MSEDKVEAILTRVLRENGISDTYPESSVHGWRCAHPDRYGPCHCVADLVDEMAEELRGQPQP